MEECPSCQMLEPTHLNIRESKLPCGDCGQWWKFEIEYVTDSDGQPVRLWHLMRWPGSAHAAYCQGCLLKPIVDLLDSRATVRSQ